MASNLDMIISLLLVFVLIGISSHFSFKIGPTVQNKIWWDYLFPFLGVPVWLILHALNVGEGVSGANFVVEMFWIFLASLSVPWIRVLLRYKENQFTYITSIFLTFIPIILTIYLRLTMPILPE